MAGSGELGWAVEIVSSLLENPAVPDPMFSVKRWRTPSGHWLSTFLAEAVTAVKNPFEAGVTLSVAPDSQSCQGSSQG